MRGLALLTLLFGPGVAAAAPFPAAWLPRHGDGYLVPDAWAARGLRYGRPELIGLVERAAARVAAEMEGALLYVADLSLKNGARTPWHRSHRDGRDADLFFYAIHENGEPVGPPDEMVPFDAAGEARLRDGTVIRFDVAKNWCLVRALLEDGGSRIHKIFVSEPLRRQLLGYAIGIQERPALIARAVVTLVEPSDSLPHDDHFHVRIAAPLLDDRPRSFARAGKPGKLRPALKAAPRGIRREPARSERRSGRRR
jgi:penicillin-insensitive murein endopeptidase